MRTPDFFIVGAPKCGTSSLFRYLALHPAIYMSPVKEPNYFSLDFPQIRRPNCAERYYNLFSKARYDQKCGEASTSYLFSKVAVKEILRVNQRAKFIVMIRNPIDMVVSLHGQKIYSFEENEPDFEIAWRLSDTRGKGLGVARTCRVPEQLNYKSVGRLGEQLERLLRAVSREQVHVIIFDDLVSDTRSVYRQVLEFLGCCPLEVEQFVVVNERKENRLPTMARVLKRPPYPLDRMRHVLRQTLPVQTARLERWIDKRIRRPAKRYEPPAEVRREMAREFADDIDLLGRLLNRDFSRWYRGA